MAAGSPRIVDDRWGRLEVEGHGTFRDAKLWPGGARTWDWTETGTDHEPGVQIEDVQELIDNGAKIVILSRGRQGALRVPAETVNAIDELGVDVMVMETDRAIEEYNRLAGDKPVGALIHSTC
ncbi:MAG: Mth938-like domain-containing protein [Spirochaetota bacterium]